MASPLVLIFAIILQIIIIRVRAQPELESQSSELVGESIRLISNSCDPSKVNCTSFADTLTSSPALETEAVVKFEERKFQSSLISIADFPQDIQDFIKQKQDIVLLIAREMEQAFKLRKKLVRECGCVLNWCSNVLGPDATCGSLLGNNDICDDQQGTMYYTNRGMAAMPLREQDPANMTDGLVATICLMNHLEKEIVPQLNALNTTGWAYVGLDQGSIWLWPGRLSIRDGESGLEQWNYCREYDPRQRPWYHEGSAGPVDIVFVVDISESMDDLVTPTLTRWDIVQDSLLKFVDTLTFTDSFNIIFFNYEGSSLSTGLLSGTAENRDKAKDFIRQQYPQGGTNFEAAFESAFSAFRAGFESGNSTDCNQVMLFLTDGKDNFVDRNINRTADLLNKVEQLQVQLQLETARRASIFSFSIGELADDAIPRQISCMHNGAWAPISTNDDPLTVFNSFLKFVASARNTSRIYWSEVYQDTEGLGALITANIPVYTPQNDINIPGAFFGVASHDIVVSDLRKLAGNYTDQVIAILQQDSQTCDQTFPNTCLQQVLRGEDISCVDLTYQQANCTKLANKYYKRFNTLSTWAEAKASCQGAGGSLAVPVTDIEQGILGGQAAYEGSWIGYSHNGDDWIWEKQNFLQQDRIWAYGQGVTSVNQIECATIAPSGTSKNLYSHKCLKQFSYICEFEDLPSSCGAEFVDLSDPAYEFLMPRINQCSTAESLESIRFFNNVEMPYIPPSELFCYDDFSTPSLIEDFQTLFCCPQA